MPLDFPNTPAINDTWTASNGVTYTFDGTKWTVSGSSIGPYLLLSGGSMTGPIVLAADPTTSPQAANKHYVDQSINLAGNYLGTWSVAANSPNINAGGSISNANYVATTVVAGTPETVPVGVPGIAGMTVANGDRIIWASGLAVWQILRNAGVTLAAADARYYAISNPSGYQTAANVTTALAPYAPLASPPLTGNPTAPTPTAGDNDTSIATTAFVQAAVASGGAASANNVGRNLIHNALFNVAQRGAGPWTTAGFSHDRWYIDIATDTVSVTLPALTDADRTAIGDEAASYASQNVFTGNAAAGAYNKLSQAIEGVRRLAGKTVTLSFFAKAAAGTPKLGLSILQWFGSGGSPSALVATPWTAVTLSTAWTRYTATTVMPSVTGKTTGTNGGDSTAINFWFSSGATNNALAGNIGVQSGTINLWGVQLEIGSVATPLEKPDPQQDLAKCQRFFRGGRIFISSAAYTPGAQLGGATQFTDMRAVPTVTQIVSNSSNLGAITYAATTNYSVGASAFATAAGNAVLDVYFNASAEL